MILVPAPGGCQGISMGESRAAREKRRARVAQYYERNREQRLEAFRSWRVVNHRRHLANNRAWSKNNRHRLRKYMRQRREGTIGQFSAKDGLRWRQKNRADFLRQKRVNTNRRRREVALIALTHYSGGTPQCYCCGETALLLLGLDHIKGGGTKHRKQVLGIRMSSWAMKKGWPKIFRVACHSCNLGAHLNGGVCPHQIGD